MFAFTPIAFMIMRGVVQGISPSLEEAAQTLRASPPADLPTVTLPLMKPGLANAFLVGFIESIADFGNPVVVGGQYSVLSTDIFFAIVGAQFDQGARRRWRWCSPVRAGVFFIQQRVLGGASYTTVSGKGDAGIPMRCRRRREVAACADGVSRPWLAVHRRGLPVRLHRRLRADLGRDHTPTLAHFRTAFDLRWGAHGPGVAGTAGTRSSHAQARGHRGAALARPSAC